jgi:exodeoxyribonuclease VII large subunit
VRAIAASPVPVVSAIGHEVDVTLADLAADIRAPTPSAAAELVVPDRNVLCLQMQELRIRMDTALLGRVAWTKEEITGLWDRFRPQRFLRKIDERKTAVADLADRLERGLSTRLDRERLLLAGMRTSLESASPQAVLARGYCVAEKNGAVVKGVGAITLGDRMNLRFYDGNSLVNVERVDHDGNI